MNIFIFAVAIVLFSHDVIASEYKAIESFFGAADAIAETAESMPLPAKSTTNLEAKIKTQEKSLAQSAQQTEIIAVERDEALERKVRSQAFYDALPDHQKKQLQEIRQRLKQGK